MAPGVAPLEAAILSSTRANSVSPPLIEGGRVPRNTPQTQPVATAEATTTPTASPTAAPYETTVPAWLSWAVTAICLAAFVIVVVALLWILMRDRLVQRRR